MRWLKLESKALWLTLALVASVLVYLPVLGSYYCGYDDFTEVYRAGFEDNVNPAQMFLTAHQGTPKYRPLNRTLIWATYRLGSGAAWAYRYRNLAGHLMCVYAVFQLAALAGQSVAGAGLTAMAFGVHPLAHQSVALSTCTNSIAYALALWSWYLMSSAWGLARPLRRLAGGTSLLLAALFTYEATIVILGPLTLELLCRRWRKESPTAGWSAFLPPLAGGICFSVLCLFGVRMLFVSGRMPITSPVVLVKNMALYLGSMAMPVDLLLLNSLIGLPLPSQLVSQPASLLRLAMVCLIPWIGLGLLWVFARRKARPGAGLWPWIWLSAIPMALSPFLLNTDHASETYLYLPVAALCLFVGGQLEFWIEPRAGIAVAAVFLAVAIPAAWGRSSRVSVCAATAETILRSLPLQQWTTGQPIVYFKNEDGFVPPPRFGLYSVHGLASIDVQSDEIASMQAALRVATGNIGLFARAVRADSFSKLCPDPGVECFTVSGQGNVKRQGQN